MELTPEQCEQLIVTHGSEASLQRYLEDVARRAGKSAAGQVEKYSHGFARAGAAYADAESGVVDVLADVAETIEKGRFPVKPLISQEDRK